MTLDISSAAPQHKPKILRPAASTAETQATPNSDRITATESVPQGLELVPEPGSQDTGQPHEAQPASINKTNAPSASNDRIQILDLHTRNPLVSYQGQLYSCTWGSTLGTDVLLEAKQPPDVPNPYGPPQSTDPVASILATSSIRLSGSPVHITAKETKHHASAGPPQDASFTNLASTPPISAAASSPFKPINGSEQKKIDVGSTPTRARQQQGAFLERLIAVKAAKGETDIVTTSVPVWNKKTHDQSERGRGRGRGGRRRRPKGRGGLFRDYVPQLGDTGGADIRGFSRGTPVRWKDLEDREARGGGVGARDGESSRRRVPEGLDDGDVEELEGAEMDAVSVEDVRGREEIVETGDDVLMEDAL